MLELVTFLGPIAAQLIDGNFYTQPAFTLSRRRDDRDTSEMLCAVNQRKPNKTQQPIQAQSIRNGRKAEWKRAYNATTTGGTDNVFRNYCSHI